MGKMTELRMPKAIPQSLPTDDDAFVSSRTATTAQWRTAALKYREMPFDTEGDRKIVRQMLRIADALGIAEDVALWPEVQARCESNVTNLPTTPPAEGRSVIMDDRTMQALRRVINYSISAEEDDQDDARCRQTTDPHLPRSLSGGEVARQGHEQVHRSRLTTPNPGPPRPHPAGLFFGRTPQIAEQHHARGVACYENDTTHGRLGVWRPNGAFGNDPVC
jgi:hypothetical protein